MHRALWLALIALAIPVFPQAQNPSRKAARQPTANELLAVPLEWNANSERLFKDSPVILFFDLTTSWIPGPDHKGMMRYRMSVAPKKPSSLAEQTDPDLYGPDAIEKLLKRTHECVISVDFYDADKFILRRIDMPFSFGIDGSARVIALMANNFVQMDADEYKKVSVGSWAVSWLCDPPSEK
jgi:hypothetical protein